MFTKKTSHKIAFFIPLKKCYGPLTCNFVNEHTFLIFYSIEEAKIIFTFYFINYDLDVNKYRSKLQSLCKKMDEFNKSNVLETLVKEQNQLELDLAGFHEQLHRYDKIPSEISRQTDYRNLKSSQKRLDNFADVKSFDTLVARTGNV